MIEQSSDVVVALSGGVDSSFAAACLQRAGWKVHGLHFRFPASLLRTKAREAAVKRVSRCLGIPFGVLDLRETFHRVVIAPFVKEYLKGLTPNPCVVCNQLIKFKYLLDYADRHGIHYIATGHYARVRKSDESPFFQLCRGRDRSKEQSYFLHRLNQTYLSRSIFPLAEKSKNRVRERACAMGLPVHAITESQEICFLPEKDYRGLVERKGGSEVRKKGNISDENGMVLGEHNGVFRYTIGQRQGLGIASARPYYVKDIRPETGEVIVGRKEAIYVRVVEAEGFNWIEKVPSQRVLKGHVQIRYRHRPAPGHLEIISNHKVKFTFDEPQWAVTPGQALVCYEGDRVIGGGWIRRRV